MMPLAAWYGSFRACQRIKQAAAEHRSVVPMMDLEKRLSMPQPGIIVQMWTWRASAAACIVLL